MSTNTLTIKAGIGVLSLAVLLGMTPVTFARTEVKNDPKTIFCDGLDKVEAKIDERITTRETNFDSRKLIRKEKINNKFTERQTALDKNRTTHDGNRATRYSKLEGKASTTAEKEAVASFQAAVEKAVDTRQAAVDVARNTFVAGVNARAVKAESEANTAIDAYKKSVDAAFVKAKNSCVSGTDGATVRASLREDIKTAREALKTARTAIGESTKTELATLRNARKSAIDSAMSAFKVTFEAEMAKLKAAFAKKGKVPLSNATRQ